MAYTKGDFYTYISGFRVEKGDEFTHTSMYKPVGSFYIPSEKIDEFSAIYKLAVKYNDDLYLTEKHRDISPFLIDIDLRFDKSENLIRRYDKTFISEIVNIYLKRISEYLEIPKEINFYVMEKTQPTLDKGLIKDGLHIIIPEIVTKPSVQFLIRNDILNDITDLLESISVKNAASDVIDESVIFRNNWQMYGSKKPQSEAYKVTSIFKYDSEKLIEKIVSPSIDHSKYIDILSIRNKYKSTGIKIEKENLIKEYEEAELKAKKMKVNAALQVNQNNKKNIYDDLNLVYKLVDILDIKRADKFDDWIKVGWCLRNIDYRLLKQWIDFSKKNSKFKDGECEKLWPYMRDDGLGIGTLNVWCKHDSPEKYREIIKNSLFSLLNTSVNETHTDIARVVHSMFKYDFVCVSIKNNLWYEFRSHRWVSCDTGHSLRTKLSNEVVQEYRNMRTYYSQKASEDNQDKDACDSKVKKFDAIVNKLKTTSFKDNIIKECKDLFYIEKFEEKLDSRCNLIGFENGVYDLDIDEFRDGRPEDYISFTTGINYIPYNPESKNINGMNDFLSKIFTLPQVKKYVLTLLSSFLNGNIREEKFHIWTGCGSNGKSKFIELFEKSFGEYCIKFPITLLTQKRASSGSATSELARSKGKRFASLQEPSEDEKLNIGLMKEISGGDKIQARMIYKEPIEFKPQFKMILCCNHLPSVPSDDGGTWRRIRVVEFTSRFCENPDPEKATEFKMDTDLSSHFDDWKEHFMSMLIEHYKDYKLNGIKEPEEVLKCTREYQRSNDCYLDFVESEMERSDFSFLSYNDVYTCFKNWMTDNAPSHMKGVQKNKAIKALDKILGKSIGVNKTGGWKGWIFKAINNNQDDLDI
jgi:P4 family phage/plasmid primase-like protien